MALPLGPLTTSGRRPGSEPHAVAQRVSRAIERVPPMRATTRLRLRQQTAGAGYKRRLPLVDRRRTCQTFRTDAYSAATRGRRVEAVAFGDSGRSAVPITFVVMWDKEMRPVLVAGAVMLFVLAVAVAFIASLAGAGGDDPAVVRGLVRVQKTVAGIGLLPALALIIAVAAGRRCFALVRFSPSSPPTPRWLCSSWSPTRAVRSPPPLGGAHTSISIATHGATPLVNVPGACVSLHRLVARASAIVAGPWPTQTATSRTFAARSTRQPGGIYSRGPGSAEITFRALHRAGRSKRC